MDDELRARYGGALWDEPLSAEEFEPPCGRFLMAWIGPEAVGCGGVCRLEDGVAHLRRMYVAPQARGRGIARALLVALEDEAGALGYRQVRLETGLEQPEAIAMYRSAGYREVPCLGPTDDLDLCFEKDL